MLRIRLTFILKIIFYIKLVLFQEVYKSLCDLDIEEKSYILETDLSSGLIGIFNCFTKLLGHPLQRQPPNFHVDYELKADEAL